MQNQFIMIQRALLFAVCCLASVSRVDAQNCIPAQNFPDTAIAIPPSWSLTRLTAGIQDTACIGSYFEFTLSVKTPATVLGIPVISIALPVQNGVNNLPAGMAYVCEPPNCVFPKDSLSCIKLFGTPSNPADVGQKDLTLTLTVNTAVIQVPLPYPNPQLDPGGHYYLHVKPAGSTGCFVPNSTREAGAPIAAMYSIPNPTSGFAQIQVSSAQTGAFDFRVMDMTGRVVHRERVLIYQGDNTLHFDGSTLPAGMYLYSLSNGAEAVTQKLVISRR